MAVKTDGFASLNLSYFLNVFDFPSLTTRVGAWMEMRIVVGDIKLWPVPPWQHGASRPPRASWRCIGWGELWRGSPSTKRWEGGWRKVMGRQNPHREGLCPAGALLTPVSLKDKESKKARPDLPPTYSFDMSFSFTLTRRWTPVPSLSSGLGQLHRPRVPLYRCSTWRSPAGSVPLTYSWLAQWQTCVLGGHCGPGAPLGSRQPGDTSNRRMWKSRRRSRRRKRRGTMGGDHPPTDCSLSYKGLWENGRKGE